MHIRNYITPLLLVLALNNLQAQTKVQQVQPMVQPKVNVRVQAEVHERTQAQVRQNILLEKNWKFTKGDPSGASGRGFDDRNWEKVTIPHDWAIKGPFSKTNDLQTVQVVQNGEKVASEKTGRTGGLPYVGVGWYRTTLPLQNWKPQQRVFLLFDGTMSQSRVFVNGKEASFWPYGYNAFQIDITDLLKINEDNSLAVRLENQDQSSRWYPGAGLYRNVHLIITSDIHIPVWGTWVTTPSVRKDLAQVRLRTTIDIPSASENVQPNENVQPTEKVQRTENTTATESKLRLQTEILNPSAKVVSSITTYKNDKSAIADQNFTITKPILWSPEHPALYTAVSSLYDGDILIDKYTTRFGIRSISFDENLGFRLNGEQRKFKGVCNHHDLGPLGAALNESALRRRLLLLKDMGCDAIRTAHNMPSPELVNLCDELGIMLIVESFDEWKAPKMKNGYHQFFDEWAEKDIVNMVHANRNHPSVVLWSIGNEVPDQRTKDGPAIAAWLQDICHREDPTRLATLGMDQIDAVLKNGFAAVLDVPGFNYKLSRYKEAYDQLPQGFLLGSETASTVSSRGTYHFPVKKGPDMVHPDNQSSSYDLEYCAWSQTPEDEFIAQDDNRFTLGEFVWTGFDYLGEPSPYESNWPSHSSYFGILDLAGIPKDRFYLYRSRWNTKANTLHLLPHWTWPGREGEITPVFCYTNYPAAELFVNGKSMGIKRRENTGVQERYRLMWNDVKYFPGTIKVVALDSLGKAVAGQQISTAGKPHHIELNADRNTLQSNGKDLAFITARVVDAKGNLCPHASNELLVSLEGNASFKTIANGDPTSLELFHEPHMKTFNGMVVITAQSGEEQGSAKLIVKSKGLKSANINLYIK